MTAQMLSAALAIAPAGPRTPEAPALDAEPDSRRETDTAELLSVMSWPGNQNNAVRITTELTQNAVDHVGAGSAEVTLSVDGDDVLLIDVSDPRSGHGGLDEALAGRRETGLWILRQLSGEVSWVAAESGTGKTIRVRLQPGEVETTAPAGETP